MQKAMRQMQTQSLYRASRGPDHATPEVQFMRILAERKLTQLRAGPPPAEHDLIIDMVLCGVRPRVWRRFRVSAKTPLASLQDKVRSPGCSANARCVCRTLGHLALCDVLADGMCLVAIAARAWRHNA